MRASASEVRLAALDALKAIAGEGLDSSESQVGAGSEPGVLQGCQVVELRESILFNLTNSEWI